MGLTNQESEYEVRLGKPAGTLRRVKGRADTLRPCATESGESTMSSFFSNAIQARHQGTVGPAKS